MEISNDTRERIEQISDSIGFGKVQDIATFLKAMRLHGITIDNILGYIEIRTTEIKKEAKRFEAEFVAQRHLKKRKLPIRDPWYPKNCPECKAPMILHDVNTGPGDITGDDSKCVHQCTKCLEQIYYNESRETLKRRRYI